MHGALWLLFGLAGLAALAVWRARRERAAFARIRASYDNWTGCGGVITAEEAADMSARQAQLPESSAPRLRWQSGRALTVFGISAAFVATSLLLPERLTLFGTHRPLEIGQNINPLQAEVETRAQEKIIDDKKAGDLQKQLAQLQKDSPGTDPDKTWEALDRIKQSNSDTAKH